MYFIPVINFYEILLLVDIFLTKLCSLVNPQFESKFFSNLR